ncbi:MAG: acetyl-CoA carboxylase carboxyltransferase subunit beta [Ruminiclostridium sp.]|nr:acetyl-CoA carboxylase carboxyltransferase subunit beta [Ruminiclostridium sp.]
MLEDLFKTVKDRFNAEKNETEKVKAPEIPKDLLFKCPRCQSVIFMDEFEKRRKTCPSCNYHARLSWKERLEITADKDSYEPFDENMNSLNPIGFPDYEKKIKRLQEANDINDAIATGVCTIRGYKTVIGIMDSNFMMASMGSVVGEKITRAFEYATENNMPVILFTASGGARMQEGIISLMQMAKTSGAVKRHSDAGGLYITVLTDPTTGGVTASFASLGDIILAEPKVLIGFAGRRVIQDTIKQRLPDDFQTAEFLLQSGFVDAIVERKAMRKSLSNILRLHNYKKQSDSWQHG